MPREIAILSGSWDHPATLRHAFLGLRSIRDDGAKCPDGARLPRGVCHERLIFHGSGTRPGGLRNTAIRGGERYSHDRDRMHDAIHHSRGEAPRNGRAKWRNVGLRRSTERLPEPGTRRALAWLVETVTQPRCEKPGTEVFIVDGSPAAALAVAAHRPSQESTYVLSRAAHERNADFKQRVLKRAERIRARERIGSLWFVVGSASIDAASSIQLLEELLPLLDGGSSVTLAAPRRHGRALFGWIDELMGKGGPDVSMGVRFYADAAPQLRRSSPQPESALQCA